MKRAIGQQIAQHSAFWKAAVLRFGDAAQEDRLTTLRSQIASLREKRQQALERLEHTMDEITLTETF